MANESENDFDPSGENTEGATDGTEDFSGTGNEGEGNESSGNESDGDGEFDAATALAALEEKFETGAVTRADFDTFKASVSRSLGQLPRLQSDFTKASAAAVDPTEVESLHEQVSLLTEALTANVDPNDPVMTKLAAARTKQATEQATRAAVARIRAEQGTPPADNDGNQIPPARLAELNEASASAKGYAQAKGVEIPSTAWEEAMQKSGGEINSALVHLRTIIDGLVPAPDPKQEERARRKAAGSAGNPPKNGSGSSASLTFEALSAMSEAEVGKLLVEHPEEVDRVLTAGPSA